MKSKKAIINNIVTRYRNVFNKLTDSQRMNALEEIKSGKIVDLKILEKMVEDTKI